MSGPTARSVLLFPALVLALSVGAGCEGAPLTAAEEGAGVNRAALRGDGPVNDALIDAVGERYIVVFRDAVGGARALQAAGAHVALSLPQHRAVAAYLPAAALSGLQRNPVIDWIEPDAIRVPLSQAVPYGIPLVEADLLPDIAGPTGATVCIIDSGYHQAHEDLAGNGAVSFAPDGGAGPANQDGCGHGSHVAGTIAAVGNDLGVVGVNPSGNLRLRIVRVFGDDCSWTYASGLVKALDQCRAVGGRIVVNMSLGGSTRSRFEEAAFNDANAAGVLSVAAAGNDGNTRKSYPASYPSVVSVAAVDASKQVASFSQRNAEVDVSAPGVGVLSTVPWLDLSRLTVGSDVFAAQYVEFSARTAGVTASLVDGGLCDGTSGAWAGRIVHCLRGTFSFYDKVRNAELSGAAGVVISNNVPGPLSATLGAGNSSAIPALGISQEDGVLVSAQAQAGAQALLESQVTKPDSGYEAWDGTSMATPHVAGVAALVWNHFPTATNTQVRDALTATAEDLGSPGRDDATGYGLVRAKAAYDRLAGSGGGSCTPTQSPESSCADGADNDCDGATDAQDTDCQGGTCQLAPVGAACTADADCCSGTCRGKVGKKTCK